MPLRRDLRPPRPRRRGRRGRGTGMQHEGGGRVAEADDGRAEVVAGGGGRPRGAGGRRGGGAPRGRAPPAATRAPASRFTSSSTRSPERPSRRALPVVDAGGRRAGAPRAGRRGRGRGPRAGRGPRGRHRRRSRGGGLAGGALLLAGRLRGLLARRTGVASRRGRSRPASPPRSRPGLGAAALAAARVAGAARPAATPAAARTSGPPGSPRGRRGRGPRWSCGGIGRPVRVSTAATAFASSAVASV